MHFAVLRVTVNEDAVPINLQVGRDTDSSRAERQLAGQVGRDRARTAGGESHVVDDAHPLALCVERFDVRRDGLNLGLVSRVDARRREVLGDAVHQQNQRSAAVRLAQIEFEASAAW